MKKRVMIIDDEKDFTELAATLLRFKNYEVIPLTDPLLITQALQPQRPDLIVTDIMMPGLDGFELIAKIRKMKDYENIPMIALSAKILTDEERKFLFQHQVHVMAKPFHPQQLLEQVHLLVGQH